MSTFEIITTVISILALVVSGVALWRDFVTRKKVDELRELEIEKLKHEKELQTKAIVFGSISNDFLIVENIGEAPAKNVRCYGWQDWSDYTEENKITFLAPHHEKKIRLGATVDSPSNVSFKIVWDDESGTDHVWSEELCIDD